MDRHLVAVAAWSGFGLGCAASLVVLALALVPASLGGDTLPRLQLGLDLEGGSIVTFEIATEDKRTPDDRAQSERAQVDRAVEGLQRRLDAADISGSVFVQGDAIRVELVGSDTSSIDALLEPPATLDLHPIIDPAPRIETIEIDGVEWRTERVGRHSPDARSEYLWAEGDDARARLEAAVARTPLPPGQSIRLGRDAVGGAPTDDRGSDAWRTFLVRTDAPVNSSMVMEASVQLDPVQGPSILVTLTRDGAAAFERMTRENVQRRIALVVDHVVLSAPVVQEPIPGGQLVITVGGRGSHGELLDEAQTLADALEVGSLPKLRVISRQHVGGMFPYAAHLVLTTLGLLMIAAFAFGATRGRRGWGLALPFAVLPGVAALSLAEATITLPLLGALVLAVLAGLGGGVALWRHPRGHGDSSRWRPRLITAGWASAPFLLLLLGGASMMLFVVGPAYGFALGLTAIGALALPMAVLLSVALEASAPATANEA